MSAPGSTATLLDLDTWQVVEMAAQVYAEHVDVTFDVARALADPEAVRDLIRLLSDQPVLRRAVRAAGAPDHQLLDPDPIRAQSATTVALALMRQRADEARRLKRAERRGSADERRHARLTADLVKTRQERASALDLVSDRDETIARLRTANAELDEALNAESRRVADAEAQRDAARLELGSTGTLAARLLAAVTADPAPVLEAAAALYPETDATLNQLMTLLREVANPVVSRQHRARRALAVDMLGGGVEVGGSCALVTADDTRILIDAGARPNPATPAAAAPPRLAEALSADIHAIVLTHAHADHAGWVPAIIAQRPTVPVYSTPATADLLPTMWADAAAVARRQGGTPTFTESDARAAVRNVRTIEYGADLTIGDLTVSLFPAGHIIGAAGVTITDNHHTVVITGDVSGPGQRTVGGYLLPERATGADLLVMESTYGNAAHHSPRERVVADFIKDVAVTVSGGGRVLVPAFALGRAQEIALLISDHLPHVPVLIDGLARDITDIYEGRTGANGKPLRIQSDRVRLVPRGHTSDTIAAFGSGVIIATSGMMAGGPAVVWARELLPDASSAVMFVGYQSPGSPGGALQRHAASDGTFALTDHRTGVTEQVDINARVATYGLGAHASSDELVELANRVRARATMLVHGDDDARAALAERLRARHMETVDAGRAWRAER